jgi:hypothetical protein
MFDWVRFAVANLWPGGNMKKHIIARPAIQKRVWHKLAARRLILVFKQFPTVRRVLSPRFYVMFGCLARGIIVLRLLGRLAMRSATFELLGQPICHFICRVSAFSCLLT